MKEKVENFVGFYHRQGLDEKRRIRDVFLEKSGLSYPGWYSKLHRKVFSVLELRALGEICGREFV